jgi:hypothetical protein
MKFRAFLFAALLAVSSGNAADAALLRCSPEPGRLQVHVHGFGKGDRIPEGLDTFSAFVRAGADEYELETEHMTGSSMRENILRIAAQRELSAGAAAELAFEGVAAANGTAFDARITFRAEGRVMQGTVRCTLL